VTLTKFKQLFHTPYIIVVIDLSQSSQCQLGPRTATGSAYIQHRPSTPYVQNHYVTCQAYILIVKLTNMIH